jgi:hypothetical protein
MIGALASMLVRDRIRDLQRAAGCCTARIVHRRALASSRAPRPRLALRRRARPVRMACCS